MNNSRVLAISFFNLRVAKNERDQVSFKILGPTIYSNQSLKSLKSCYFNELKAFSK